MKCLSLAVGRTKKFITQ